VWLAAIASLVCSGCVALAVAPVAGAAVGAAVAAARNQGDRDISYGNHIVVGTLAGVLVDAIAIVVLINEIKREDFEIRQLPPLPAR
jgi:hypothetical protein